MNGRQTSGMMFSYIQKSQYHDSCIPKDKQIVVTESSKTFKDGDFSKCDNVTQDTIWKQSVDKEKKCLKNWESSWGFLADFDAEGNVKEEEEVLPEKAVVFSDDVPNTNSGNYGNRVNTDLGATMAQMEFQFYSGGRRKKLGDDMICY